MELFRPVRNIWNRAHQWTRASVSAAGIAWMSRFIYRYHRLMLMNLSPRQPATEHWPLYLYPPPHLLVGYQHLLRLCNDYIFDTRAYSRLRYTEVIQPHYQVVNWSVLGNCSYTINTGAYHRFLDLDDFSDSLQRMQQAILAERVVADLALLRPMRGYGRTHLDADRDVPVAHLLQEQLKDIGRCQQEAWGMADRIRLQRAGRKDLTLLRAIRQLKTAYFHFLVSRHLRLPTHTALNLPCDCCWLDAFVERFAGSEEQVREFAEAIQQQEVPTRELTRCIISALSLPLCSGSALRGGAFELRPREGGRAVTETMRRMRGEVIERFVDRLPLRRRRPRPAPPVPAEAAAAAEEEDEEMPPLEGEEEEEAAVAGPSAPPPSFEEEVRQAVAEAIAALEEELTVSARQHEFFRFAPEFYRVMQRLEDLGDINELTLHRWVINFFLCEHIATTLNYLHHALRLQAPFNRLVALNLAQVVMRARDADGQLVYSRVWNENGENALVAIMNRITVDLAATVERAGHGDLDEDELEQFMQDIAYRENSGDVSEILRQVATHDADIDSVELSFRFRVTGPVVFSGNPQIQNINRRVIAHASRLRRDHLPLPELNAPVPLAQLPA